MVGIGFKFTLKPKPNSWPNHNPSQHPNWGFGGLLSILIFYLCVCQCAFYIGKEQVILQTLNVLNNHKQTPEVAKSRTSGCTESLCKPNLNFDTRRILKRYLFDNVSFVGTNVFVFHLQDEPKNVYPTQALKFSSFYVYKKWLVLLRNRIVCFALIGCSSFTFWRACEFFWGIILTRKLSSFCIFLPQVKNILSQHLLENTIH